MDAIAFLLKEHNKVRRTLSAISKLAKIDRKKTKFNALAKDLIRHETMEQKVWYPALRKKPDLRKPIQHLVAEEKSAAQAIRGFKGVSLDLLWKLKFYKLKHDVLHHAREEETKLFPKVRKHFTKAELSKLGSKMQKFKATSKKKNPLKKSKKTKKRKVKKSKRR